MKKILIIGATGLIGSYLIKDLSVNFKICATKNKSEFKVIYDDVEYYTCSITNKKDFENLPKDIDVVIMLAGVLPASMKGYEPEIYISVNTMGMLNVLEYCRKNKVKQIIYTQTHSDVKKLWGKETINPYSNYDIDYNNDHTIYCISKIAALELIKHYNVAYGLNYAIFRCPNIYAWSPEEYYYYNGEKKIIAYRYFIKRAMESLPIEVFGNSKSKRDVVYIKDLTQLIEKSIQNEIQHSIYNVSNGEAISVEQQVKDIINVFSPKDNPSKINYKPEICVEGLNYHYDISNAINELGYKPKYFHKEMLLDMKEEINNSQKDVKKLVVAERE